jgi:deferrochelatase/peroxidase EfeB
MSSVDRRNFLKSAGGTIGAIALGGTLPGSIPAMAVSAPAPGRNSDAVSFHGPHQAGITTPQQGHTYFVAFDIVAKEKSALVELLKAWTKAGERLSRGLPAAQPEKDLEKPGTDSGEADGLPASRLTITFGFGFGLFTKNGLDRFGMGHLKPDVFTELPKFHGDQLVDARSGGDISVQACADDPQVAFHAVRQLARLAENILEIRWAQSGFLGKGKPGDTPRNLMGFKDGTQQPAAPDHNRYVWVGEEGPEWLRGGSYLVVRRVRIALEHWDRTEVGFQEQVIGRHKATGAPLGKAHEREDLGLDRTDKDGNPVIPQDAHVRMAAAASNGGAQMLRRGYSYNDGVNFVAERWPPWHQGLEYDAGLFFLSYQKNLQNGFVKIFSNLAKLDSLNQFATHVGSGVFICPPGVRPGQYIGQALLEA